MAMTLVEYLKTVTTPIEAFVIDEFLESPILMDIPFKSIQGNSYRYNKADTLPGVGFRGINEVYTESVGILNPQVEPLKILGGDLDVDKFILDTEGQAGRASHTRLKLKASRKRFDKTFFKGDSSAEPREFDGLQRRVTGNQLIVNGADGTGNVLSLDSLDEMIDRVEGNDSTKKLYCNSAMRRRISAVARNTSLGGHVNFQPNELGIRAMFYRDCEIKKIEEDDLGNEILPFTETSPDGSSTTDNTSIYCVQYGDMECTGLQWGGGPQVRDLGEIDTKPVFRTRIDWYIGLALMNGRSAARLYGVQDGTAEA